MLKSRLYVGFFMPKIYSRYSVKKYVHRYLAIIVMYFIFFLFLQCLEPFLPCKKAPISL